MAIGLRRKVRLDSRRERQALRRQKNGNDKRPERARRDARLKAKLAANLSDPAPEVQSWVARQLGKPVRQCSEAELKALAEA